MVPGKVYAHIHVDRVVAHIEKALGHDRVGLCREAPVQTPPELSSRLGCTPPHAACEMDGGAPVGAVLEFE